jgi:hypothetical protein
MLYVVKKCVECPFFAPKDEKLGTCGASIPRFRLVDKDEDRPSFCVLRREQVIVREFS